MTKLTYRHTLIACSLANITQAVNINLAPILFIVFREQFGISYDLIGTLILVNFGTQLIIDFVTVKVADKIGCRPCMIAGCAFSVAGLTALSVLPRVMPAFVGLLLATVVYSAGSGVIEMMSSPIVDSLPGERKASVMSLIHSFYCWGQLTVVLVTTLILSAIAPELWYWLPLGWAAAPVAPLLLFFRVPIVDQAPESERPSIKKLLTSRIFMVAMLIMVCGAASEQVMAQWSSLFAQEALLVPKVTGDLLGPCVFAAFMGTGRMIMGIWGHRIDLQKALLLCATAATALYLVVALASAPIVALLACGLTGFAVSLMWPGTLSMTAQRFPSGGARSFGILGIMGDVGCSLGPWITGMVSEAAQGSAFAAQSAAPDQFGLKAGMLVTTLFPLLMVVGLLVFRRTREVKG